MRAVAPTAVGPIAFRTSAGKLEELVMRGLGEFFVATGSWHVVGALAVEGLAVLGLHRGTLERVVGRARLVLGLDDALRRALVV